MMAMEEELSLTRHYDKLFKVLLVGESGCGKTSLLKRYVESTFDPLYLSTIVVDFKMKTLKLQNGKSIKLQLWDTSGRDRHVHFFENFMRGASAALFCFDKSDRRSFEKLHKWLELVQKHDDSNLVKFLVACKNDVKRFGANDNNLVSDQEALNAAIEQGCRFVSTSAKEDLNVDKLFEDVAEIVFDVIKDDDKESNDDNVEYRVHDDNVFRRLSKSLRRSATRLRRNDNNRLSLLGKTNDNFINNSRFSTNDGNATTTNNAVATSTTSSSSCCTIS